MVLVKEDSLPGTVILELSTTDEDVVPSDKLSYYITNGDRDGQFGVKKTGEVFLAQILDRETIESYVLHVAVSDGKFVAETIVHVQVLDANGKDFFFESSFCHYII